MTGLNDTGWKIGDFVTSSNDNGTVDTSLTASYCGTQVHLLFAELSSEDDDLPPQGIVSVSIPSHGSVIEIHNDDGETTDVQVNVSPQIVEPESGTEERAPVERVTIPREQLDYPPLGGVK